MKKKRLFTPNKEFIRDVESVRYKPENNWLMTRLTLGFMGMGFILGAIIGFLAVWVFK